MKRTPIPQPDGFQVSPHIWSSFVGQPAFFRLSGPGGLVRFIQDAKTTREGETLRASRTAGDCWFDERAFSTLRERAKAELHRQFGKQKSGVQFRALVGLYLRLCLRSDLAVSKDWNEFDRYAVLPLRPNDEVVALVGRIKEQPAYSQGHPAHLPAELAGLRLPGSEEQFIMDFQFPANQSAERRILGPFFF